MNLDCHQHFWRYNADEYPWINDRMAALRRDFLPEDLAREQAAIGFEGSIVIQARQTLEETRWLLQLADEYPLIKGVVGWVDLRSPEVGEQLRRFVEHPRFCGVRHVLQDEPDDRFMLNEDFVRGVGVLGDFGIPYDILITPRHLPHARALVERFPEQPFVLNHIAKPFIKDGIMEPWATEMGRLAENANVFCKASDMVTEADWERWQPEDFHPYLDVVFEAFGAERVMIGSDWPVCTVAGSYEQVMGIVQDYIEGFSAEEKRAVLGGNAVRVYGVR